jgi:hypothetical protein
MNRQCLEAAHGRNLTVGIRVDLVLQRGCPESYGLFDDLLRLLVILADADHNGPTGEVALEVTSRGLRQQHRVDVGRLKVLQDSAWVSQ